MSLEPISIAVIDSGVNPTHPHIGGIAAGIGIGPDGTPAGDWIDRLGHGTAVAAAIHEKAPAAALHVVKVFDGALLTDIRALVGALDWASTHRMRLVNLSLGTSKPEHEPVLRDAVARAVAAGTWIVAAAEQDGNRWLPGSLPGVIGVELDWSCPRDECRVAEGTTDRLIVRAAGYPRPIPGVPPDRNLKGLSFAVANATGLLARTLERGPSASLEAALAALAAT